MPDAIPDLWPSDLRAPTTVVPPVAILKRQGALLSDKTQGVVGAIVLGAPSLTTETSFTYDFYLTAPAIGSSYKYHLFTIQHGMSLYPVKVSRPDHPVVEVAAETDFLTRVREILSDAKTRQVIDILWAQSEAG